MKATEQIVAFWRQGFRDNPELRRNRLSEDLRHDLHVLSEDLIEGLDQAIAELGITNWRAGELPHDRLSEAVAKVAIRNRTTVSGILIPVESRTDGLREAITDISTRLGTDVQEIASGSLPEGLASLEPDILRARLAAYTGALCFYEGPTLIALNTTLEALGLLTQAPPSLDAIQEG